MLICNWRSLTLTCVVAVIVTVLAVYCWLLWQQSSAEVQGSAADMSTVSCDMSDWESVVMEQEHWTVLVQQLLDLLAVQSLLLMRPAPDSISKPPWQPDSLSITLKRVLDGGKGLYSVSVCVRSVQPAVP